MEGRIAFHSGDGFTFEIYIIDADGGRLRQLTQHETGSREGIASDRARNVTWFAH